MIRKPNIEVRWTREHSEFIRPLRPCVLVLVFVINDFANNHPVLQALDNGRWDPDHNPFVTAEKAKMGHSVCARPVFP